MRKFTLIATVVVLLANIAWVSKVQAQWPQSTTKDPRWTVEFGGKAYDRPGAKLGLPLITDDVTKASLFNSNQASSLGSAGGAEIKFGFVSQTGREFEIRSIITDWAQDFEITGDNLSSPFFTDPANAPTTVNYNYEADYFSIELMARQAIAPGITCVFGPRFISTKDQVTFAGSLLVDPGNGTTVTVTESQNTEATNSMIGLQGGFEFNVPVRQDVYVNSFIRTGGYMNPTEVTTQVTNSTLFTQAAPGVRTKSTGSFMAEVGGRIYVDVVPNCMSTYAGYEATWIDGLAVAPDQIIGGMGGIETANTVFFHAITFGINLTY